MNSDEALELTQRMMRENEQRRADRIAKGKAAAPPSKEPIDLARLKTLAATDALDRMTDAELLLRLEELYYVDHPKLTTLEQLAAIVEQLASY